MSNKLLTATMATAARNAASASAEVAFSVAAGTILLETQAPNNGWVRVKSKLGEGFLPVTAVKRGLWLKGGDGLNYSNRVPESAEEFLTTIMRNDRQSIRHLADALRRVVKMRKAGHDVEFIRKGIAKAYERIAARQNQIREYAVKGSLKYQIEKSVDLDLLNAYLGFKQEGTSGLGLAPIVWGIIIGISAAGIGVAVVYSLFGPAYEASGIDVTKAKGFQTSLDEYEVAIKSGDQAAIKEARSKVNEEAQALVELAFMRGKNRQWWKDWGSTIKGLLLFGGGAALVIWGASQIMKSKSFKQMQMMSAAARA